MLTDVKVVHLNLHGCTLSLNTVLFLNRQAQVWHVVLHGASWMCTVLRMHRTRHA